MAVVAHEVAWILCYMLKRCEPYRGVKMGLWERRPVEVGEKCLSWFAELDWIPLGIYVSTRFSIGACANKAEPG